MHGDGASQSRRPLIKEPDRVLAGAEEEGAPISGGLGAYVRVRSEEQPTPMFGRLFEFEIPEQSMGRLVHPRAPTSIGPLGE